MLERRLFGWTKRALWNFHGREEVTDLEVRCCWRAGSVVTEELPGGLFVEP